MAAHSDPPRARRESRRYIFILLVNLLPLDNPLAFFPPRARLARDFSAISKLALYERLGLKMSLGFCARLLMKRVDYFSLRKLTDFFWLAFEMDSICNV